MNNQVVPPGRYPYGGPSDRVKISIVQKVLALFCLVAAVGCGMTCKLVDLKLERIG